jgi:hypothetical protein
VYASKQQNRKCVTQDGSSVRPTNTRQSDQYSHRNGTYGERQVLCGKDMTDLNDLKAEFRSDRQVRN